MSIDYSAVVAVGVQRKDIEDFGKYEELIDDCTLEVFSPYYDGSSADDAIVGFAYGETSDYSSTELVWDQRKIDDLKEEFAKLTGMQAKVWLTPHGN